MYSITRGDSEGDLRCSLALFSSSGRYPLKDEAVGSLICPLCFVLRYKPVINCFSNHSCYAKKEEKANKFIRTLRINLFNVSYNLLDSIEDISKYISEMRDCQSQTAAVENRWRVPYDTRSW